MGNEALEYRKFVKVRVFDNIRSYTDYHTDVIVRPPSAETLARMAAGKKLSSLDSIIISLSNNSRPETILVGYVYRAGFIKRS